MKKLTRFCCALSLILSLAIAPYASASGLNSTTIKGQVVLSIKFTPEEADAYKESMRDAKRVGVEYIKGLISETDDSDKIEYLMTMLQTAEAEDTDSYFKLQPDGTYEINMPHRNANIIVDGAEYSTDQNGYYEIPKQLKKKVNIQLEKENHEMMSVDVNLDSQKSQSNEIKIVKSFEEFAEGIQHMGTDMEAEAQGIVTYPKIAKNGHFGNGAGRSKVYKDKNIVGCNKHDKNLNSITTKQFALQSSDCSVSVKLGIMASQGVALALIYGKSLYCVDEAITSDDNSTAGNVYCNGKSTQRNGSSKGSHINCSWFTGVGHTEEAHTHN